MGGENHFNPVIYSRFIVFNFSARITLPAFLRVEDDSNSFAHVIAAKSIPAKTRLGPFEAKRTTLDIDGPGRFVLKAGPTIVVIFKTVAWLVVVVVSRA